MRRGRMQACNTHPTGMLSCSYIKIILVNILHAVIYFCCYFFQLCVILSNIVVMYSADKTTKPSGSPSSIKSSFLVILNINVTLFINWILRHLN